MDQTGDPNLWINSNAGISNGVTGDIPDFTCAPGLCARAGAEASLLVAKLLVIDINGQALARIPEG